MTRVLIVTPLHNEEDNIAGLEQSLEAQVFRSFDWVLVDDGSTDSTPRIAQDLASRGLASVVSKKNDGGLIGGSAYTSWRYGVANAPRALSEYTHVMKLDADVRLPQNYLELAIQVFDEDELVGIAGGRIITPGMREQALHVPGPVKLYSSQAFNATTNLPSAIGFDVMDEVAVAAYGLKTVVLRDLTFDLSRAIGASQGGIHGRYRNGRMCRWTGYDTIYFLIHMARYIFRKPYLVGSIAMIVGYLRAGSGPYPKSLRTAHTEMQRAKLSKALRNPLKFARETY